MNRSINTQSGTCDVCNSCYDDDHDPDNCKLIAAFDGSYNGYLGICKECLEKGLKLLEKISEQDNAC